jgi:hypothetical protein
MKLFGKKVVKLGHAERVAVAQQQAQEALGLFQKAHDQLEEANIELMNVANDAQRQAEELLKQVDKANEEIRMNTAVQGKLKEFVR